jgi:hypothetical protein
MTKSSTDRPPVARRTDQQSQLSNVVPQYCWHLYPTEGQLDAIPALSECDHLLDWGTETNGIMPFAAGVVRNRLDSARLKSRQIR